MISDRERLLLDILATSHSIQEAEKDLMKQGITLNSAYKMLERLRKKAVRWQTGVNQMLGYRRKSKLLNKVLWYKKRLGD